MHLPEITFPRGLVWQKLHLPEFTFPRKLFFQNLHLPEFTFSRNYISPKTYFPEFTLARIYIWPKLHFPRNLFSRNCTHQPEISLLIEFSLRKYVIMIVHFQKLLSYGLRVEQNGKGGNFLTSCN